VFLSDRSVKAIRAFDPYHYGLMGWFLSKFLSLPFCVSVHADYEKREALQGNVIPRILGSMKISKWVEKFVYKHADVVLPIRDHMREHLVRAGCSDKKIRVFPHGVDMSGFDKAWDVDIRKLLELPAGAKIVSWAGRLERENYCDDLIDIASKSVRKIKDLYFVICGNGSQLERLENRFKSSGLQERILFVGSIAQKTVIDLRKQSDVNLCLMGGFSLIEACASGRPVISYDVEWHYELVKNEESGFLVPENDINTVVEKIEFLLRNPERAESLGNKAKKLAFKKHSLEVANRIKTEIYEELLSEHLR
jgi:glycosyltransferase involved in cell wall biosynthesis